MGAEMAGDSVKLELLPLKEYKQRGFKGLAMQYLECMGVHELQDAKVDLSKYEQVSVPNPFKGADVISAVRKIWKSSACWSLLPARAFTARIC